MSSPNRTRQLARAFVTGTGLVPAPERLAALAEELGRPGLAARPIVARFPDGTLAQRYMIASASLDWTLTFVGESFDLARIPVDATGSNLDTLPIFANEAARVFRRCVDAFQVVPYRLSLVEEGLVTTELEEAFLTEAAKLAFRLPPIFQEAPPFEWDWRCCTRKEVYAGDLAELCNVIGTIKRVEGTMSGAAGPMPIRTLRVDAELNTVPNNTAQRFTADRMQAFYENGAAVVGALADELLQHVGWAGHV